MSASTFSPPAFWATIQLLQHRVFIAFVKIPNKHQPWQTESTTYVCRLTYPVYICNVQLADIYLVHLRGRICLLTHIKFIQEVAQLNDDGISAGCLVFFFINHSACLFVPLMRSGKAAPCLVVGGYCPHACPPKLLNYYYPSRSAQKPAAADYKLNAPCMHIYLFLWRPAV